MFIIAPIATSTTPENKRSLFPAFYDLLMQSVRKVTNRPPCKVALGWHWGTWVWGVFPPFPDKSGSQCLDCVQTIWFMLNTCFPSESLKCSCMCQTEVSMWPASPNPLKKKTLGNKSLIQFPGQKHHTHYCIFTAAEGWALYPSWRARALEACTQIASDFASSFSLVKQLCVLIISW